MKKFFYTKQKTPLKLQGRFLSSEKTVQKFFQNIIFTKFPTFVKADILA